MNEGYDARTIDKLRIVEDDVEPIGVDVLRIAACDRRNDGVGVRIEHPRAHVDGGDVGT